jgi:hypothetical protein
MGDVEDVGALRDLDLREILFLIGGRQRIDPGRRAADA